MIINNSFEQLRCIATGCSKEWLEEVSEEASVISVLFRRKKQNKFIVDILDYDPKDNQSVQPTIMDDQHEKFKLDLNEDYNGSFAFIDDERNRIFVHFHKFNEHLVDIEVLR